MEFLCGLVIASGGSSRIGRGQARASVAARLVRAKTMAKTLLDKLSSSKQVHRSRASLPRLRRGASVVAVAAAFSSGSSTWVEGAWPISEQNTSEVRFGQLLCWPSFARNNHKREANALVYLYVVCLCMHAP